MSHNQLSINQLLLKWPRESILVSFILISVIVYIPFYWLMPLLLNYAQGLHENNKIMTLTYGSPYIVQYGTALTLAIIVFAIPLYLYLDGINNWEQSVLQKDKINIKRIRKKCSIIPYYIILFETILPIVAILGYAIIFFIVKYISIYLIINLVKMILLFFSTLSTIGVISFIFTKRICHLILIKTDIDGSYPGHRIPFRNNLAAQMMLMFIVGIMLTALAGYSKLVEEKGDLFFDLNKKNLTNHFTPGSKYSVDTLKSLLNKVDLYNSSFNTFYIGENGDEYTSDNLKLYKDFKIYIKYLSQNYNGRVMIASGELQGTVVKIQTDKGHYWVGIKYEVVSKKMVLFFIITSIVMLILNGAIFFYFSHSISNDISIITKNLHKIGRDETVDFDKQLPVVSNDEIGDLVIAFNKIQKLFKEHVTYIKNSERIFHEKERLASLGQLIGGIAHNLRSPLMSLAGGLEGLNKLIFEYDKSIEDSSVTSQDHHEIAKEMAKWIKKMKPYCSYMSDVITTVKEHSVHSTTKNTESFTVNDLIIRIKILMNNELKRNNTELIIHDNLIEPGVMRGNPTILLQVMNNLIINAIDAYENKRGSVNLSIKQIESYIEFQVKDHGKGIPKDIQKQIFKKMVTTKGRKGNGLGLFISVSKIISNFNGSMWFKSIEGVGTSFFVRVPYIKTILTEKNSTTQ